MARLRDGRLFRFAHTWQQRGGLQFPAKRPNSWRISCSLKPPTSAAQRTITFPAQHEFHLPRKLISFFFTERPTRNPEYLIHLSSGAVDNNQDVIVKYYWPDFPHWPCRPWSAGPGIDPWSASSPSSLVPPSMCISCGLKFALTQAVLQCPSTVAITMCGTPATRAHDSVAKLAEYHTR